MTTTAVTAVTAAAIAAAARHLRDGRLVAFPTETVYGLGVDATNADAVARLYAAKGRPLLNPLIVHVATLEEAQRLGVASPAAMQLAAAFWPGPLTLLASRRPECPIPLIVTAGLDTLALRCPDHAVARALIEATGRPIAAPSANRSGRLSPTAAADVAADFPDGALAMILDGGPCRHGLESTIVDATSNEPRLLRPGAVAREDLERVLGGPLATGVMGATGPTAPGQLASHYAPRATLRLNATSVAGNEAYLGFAGSTVPGLHKAIATADLSPSGDLNEAAAALYGALRRLDASGARTIAVAPIASRGLGEAINDRLARAAAPR